MKPEPRHPHVLIIPSWYPTRYNPVGGSFFREQAQALAEHLGKVGILAPLPIPLKDVLWAAVRGGGFPKWNEVETDRQLVTFRSEYLSFPKMRRRTQRLRVEIGLALYERYVKAHGRPDLVHCHSFAAGEIALKIQRADGLPFVTTEHSSAFFRDLLTPQQAALAKEVFSAAKVNLAVSQALAERLGRDFGTPFRFVPNMVDTEFFSPASGPRPGGGGYRFLSVGLLDANKNHEMLIAAFSRAFGGQPGVSLTIVGGGREHGNLQRQIRELGLGGQVELTGLRNRDEVRELMRSSDALVLPSRHETFGVVLIEALSCGIPVVATRSGGPESIIDDSVGILCEVTIEGLGGALRAIRGRSFDRAFLRKRVLDRYSRAAVCAQLTAIYLEATR